MVEEATTMAVVTEVAGTGADVLGWARRCRRRRRWRWRSVHRGDVAVWTARRLPQTVRSVGPVERHGDLEMIIRKPESEGNGVS